MKNPMNNTKASLPSVIWDYVVITFGVFLYTLAWSWMMIPNGIASGGLTGACTILNFATGIPVYLSFGVINVLLLIGFGFKTIYAIGLSSLFLGVLAKMDSMYLFFDNKLLLVVVAGVIESTGIALILDRGGSTGGTDIVALIINKFWPISLGRVFLVTDMVIIASFSLLLIVKR